MTKNSKRRNHPIKGRMCTKKGFSMYGLLIIIAFIAIIALLVFPLFTPTTSEKAANQTQGNVILLADAEQDYYKKHKKYTNSVLTLASDDKQVERFVANDNITISKNSARVTIKEIADTSFSGLFNSNDKTTTFAITQTPDKRIKSCAGETKCKNGEWVD